MEGGVRAFVITGGRIEDEVLVDADPDRVRRGMAVVSTHFDEWYGSDDDATFADGIAVAGSFYRAVVRDACLRLPTREQRILIASAALTTITRLLELEIASFS